MTIIKPKLLLLNLFLSIFLATGFCETGANGKPCKNALLEHVLEADANHVVKGQVIDSLDNPLSGVNVSIKGTSKGTITDANGLYTIADVPETATLVFSFVGYVTQEIPVGQRKQIDVQLLQSSTGLGEVVILGFGQTQKKIAQTGSISSIGTKELLQSPVANVTNALAGRLPGLITIQRSGEPGADASQLFIRGVGTLNGNSPLIIIDGVESQYNNIALLDPNAIESVTILKDASATALYGVKGANGVIIITTRRGKVGKPISQFRLEQGVQTAIRLPHFANSYDFARLSNEAYLNDHPGGTSLPYSDEVLEAYRTHSDLYRYPDVDWVKEMIKSANMTKANYNISGGTKQIRYFVNTGYLSQDGLFRLHKMDNYDPNILYKRYNFRSNVDINFDKDFSISLNLFGAIENKNGPLQSIDDLFQQLLRVPPNATAIKYPIGVYGYSAYYGVGNPIGTVQESGFYQAFNSALSGKLSVQRKLDAITPGLSLMGNYSFSGNYYNTVNRSRQPYFALYQGGDLMDTSSYHFEGVENAQLAAPVSATNQNRNTWLDISLNYHHLFGEQGNHDVTGLILANRQQNVISGQIPFVSQGLVGRFAYSYKNKYFIEFDAGYNGTDNFSKKHRYGFFPAYSAAWVVSSEPFLRESKFINYLKIRGSYGMVGNDQLRGRRWLFIGEFNRGGGYSFGDPATWVPGVYEGAIANPDITWETAKKANLGIDLHLWHNMLGITFDVFHEKRINMLIVRGTIPSMVGVGSNNLPPANLGETEKKGFELVLSHQNSFGRDFSYFINGNVTYAYDKILSMDEPHHDYDYQYSTGHPIGQFFGLTAIGFFKDDADIAKSPAQFGTVIPGDIKYLDRNKDGVIDVDDIGYIGNSSIPEIMFGLSAGMRWKKLDISFLIQGARGYNVMFSGYAAYDFVNMGKLLQSMVGRWTPETANTATYPALHLDGSPNNHRASTFFLKNANYTRLKNLEVGYTFGDIRNKNGFGISAFRVYLNGMNLITWDNVGENYDPESPSGNGSVYPQQRVINAGISLNF